MKRRAAKSSCACSTLASTSCSTSSWLRPWPGCTVTLADKTTCAEAADGLFRAANMYVTGPRAKRIAVLTGPARAKITSATAEPFNLAAGGKLFFPSRDGYLYADTADLAWALWDRIKLDHLFDEPEIMIERGNSEIHVRRDPEKGYRYVDGPDAGVRPVGPSRLAIVLGGLASGLLTRFRLSEGNPSSVMISRLAKVCWIAPPGQ